MMGWNSAVEVIACIFRTGINGGGPIAPGRLIPPPYPNIVILDDLNVNMLKTNVLVRYKWLKKCN